MGQKWYGWIVKISDGPPAINYCLTLPVIINQIKNFLATFQFQSLSSCCLAQFPDFSKILLKSGKWLPAAFRQSFV
jgi:hypothetical protein